MKKIFFSIVFFYSFIIVSGQGTGINRDPYQKSIGEMPYEMKDRTEERIPLISFDDAEKWKVTTKNCEVKLYRTKEQRVFREYSGKIIYKTTAKKAEFNVELIDPVELKEPWDCINFWNYGDHWLWGEPLWTTAMDLSVIIEDAGGKIHKIKMVQEGYGKINYKYWFLSHMKLKEEIKGPAKFIGFNFKSNNSVVGEEHVLFLESVYVYKEVLKPLTFKKLPEKMPFPLRKQTILPVNKVKKYKNEIKKVNGKYSFSYKAQNADLVYEVDPESFLKNISVSYNGGKKVNITNDSKIVLDLEGDVIWKVEEQEVRNDTLFINYLAGDQNKKHGFNCWYTIDQKSLICSIEEKGEEGIVSEIKLGSTDAAQDARLVPVPILNYNYKERPYLLYLDELFYFTMFDWYYSNASLFFAGRPRIRKGQAAYNGGVRYIPLINGKRNLLREKLFINVSPDVQEVFPVIDNPISTKRSVQADRFWAINGGTDLEKLGEFVTDLRSKGLEKVTIRYHEGFWRKGGESYTFKLTPNPDLGVKKIRDYVAWVQSNDWKVGLYSNYTDFAPVNAHWNEDWIKRGPKGEWQVSWSRCYAPKPQIAWEQEAYFAPRIQKMFHTDHSYCDVHTAVSPMSRVDYDNRVPGAGTFRHVISCYGLLLMNESKTYGPVYSEGGNHWWYAGLLDGNYANGNLDKLPVFPDFQLLQVHPKEMDAGNTGDESSYLAYTLAYGNIGKLSEGLDAVKRYAMIQPLQQYYVMTPVKKIEYFDQGKAFNSSDAVKKDLIKAPKLHLVYESGLQVYTNFSEENWEVRVNKESFILPKYGILAYLPGSDLISFSGRNNEFPSGKKTDIVISDELSYIDSYGETVTKGKIRGKGSYMLKKEKAGWEIIPLGDPGMIDFDISLLHLNVKKISIQAVDRNSESLKLPPVNFNSDAVKFRPQAKAYKYKVRILK